MTTPSPGAAAADRRAKLIAEHGTPRRVPAGPALTQLGLRHQVHPADTVAFAYRDLEAARAWQASNATHNHVPSLGLADGEDGEVIGVLDLRGGLTQVTDPALPDPLPHEPPSP